MTFISLVINADSRSGFKDNESTADKMFEGCRSMDFLIEGVRNKIKFFEGFEKEVILFIDEHEIIPAEVIQEIRFMVDTLVVRKHDKNFKDIKDFASFNDLNYLSALQLARGEIICHADQDTAMFTNDQNSVQELIDMLKDHKFVSYPSYWSPRAITDPSFGNRTWASTRFFLCKRDALKFDTLMHCIEDAEWAYQTFGDSPRRCNWLEHFLTMTNNDSCYYPTMDLTKRAIFCWKNYKTGVLDELNKMSYQEVKKYIEDCGNIQYPCDLISKQI
jgi:hypothetical protein